MKRAILIVSLLAMVALSGCLSGDSESNSNGNSSSSGYPTVQDRSKLPFDKTGAQSKVLQPGPYKMLEPLSVFFDVDMPVTEGGNALIDLDGVQAHMGIFLPDVPAGTKVPVIADIGPYYGESGSDNPANEPANRLGGFLIENFVQHGFAVAQVSVLGSGQSEYCFDMMGDAEQAGVVAAVDYLANQDWSNGNVGLIGRSYDGSTPWQAAAHAPEGLKTIVPISGLTGIPELMFFQGSPETRTLTFHNVVYGTFAVDGDAGDVGAVACPDYLASSAYQASEVGFSWATGRNAYFEERDFLVPALQNYQGSVYLIHGLQDWNVDPHTALPYYQLMQERWETKLLAGQWDHAYPDRFADHSDLPSGKGKEAFPATIRMDWAQDLLEWFTYYLKETGPKPQLVSEVQDNLGGWHAYESFPPHTSNYLNLEIAAGTAPILPLQTETYDLGVISETQASHIAGFPMLFAKVTATGPSGQIYAKLESVAPDGTALRLGHSAMDARFHKGGLNGEAITPGDTFIMHMQFEALDVIVPAGHSLRLSLNGDGTEESYTVASGFPLLLDQASSTIQLPLVPVNHMSFTPPTYAGNADGPA